MFGEYNSNTIIPTNYHTLINIYPIWVGHLTALPNYECKPRVLDDFFIVYISSGKGVFRCKGKVYTLEKYDAFFLFPGIVHSYATDPKDLLEVWWIGFSGPIAQELLKSIGITPESPVLKGIKDKEVFSTIKETITDSTDSLCGSELKAAGSLYRLFGHLVSINNSHELVDGNYRHNSTKPIEKALTFIEANYPHEISVKQIAAFVGLSKTHFATRFKEEVGCSPSEQLAKIRLKQAKFHLSCSDLSIIEIARSVGFQDPQYFSRFFRKHVGISASRYREEMAGNSVIGRDVSKASF